MYSVLMRLQTIIVTRSKAAHVKTLHTILRLNIRCLQRNVSNEINFVNDDSLAKSDAVNKCLKGDYDRILFIDFGVSLDDKSLDMVFEDVEGYPVMVFPGPKEGIDWAMFKKKVLEDVKEPLEQMGTHFDTEVGRKIKESLYNVTSTEARVWVMNVKPVKKKVDGKLPSNFFKKMIDQGVKIVAFTASRPIMTYTHECISSILNAAGVKQSA